MKTYEIWKCTKEFPYKERGEIIEGCTIPDEEPEIISAHESLAKAEAALEKHSTTARTYSGGAGKYIGVTEYCVVSYDPDEFVQSADVCAITKMVEVDEMV